MMIEPDEEMNAGDLPALIAELSTLYPKRADDEWSALEADFFQQVQP